MLSASPRTPRLGDILVARGYCTARQIEEALDEQVVYDGRLGTNLLELGIVTEEQLARALAVQFGRPARWGPIAVDRAALASMPAASAERWQAVPLRLEGRCLEVLVCELRNPTRLDEMAFALGKEIRPVLVTETRLWELLHRYYGVPVPERRGRSGHRGEEGGLASHQEILADLQTSTGRYTPVPAAGPAAGAGSAVPGPALERTAAGSVVPRAVTPTRARAPTPAPSRPAVPPVLPRVTPPPSAVAIPAATRVTPPPAAAIPAETRVMATLPPPAAPARVVAPDASSGDLPARTRVMPAFAPAAPAAGPVASRLTPPPLPRTPPPPLSRAAAGATPAPGSGVLPADASAPSPGVGFEPAVDTDPGIVADLQAFAARQLRRGASAEPRGGAGPATTPPQDHTLPPR